MNNFWAKVNLKQGENASELLRAFFTDFNPESSIYIKGKVAEMRVFFEKPPLEIVKAIGECDNIEFIFGESLKETESPSDITNENFEKVSEEVKKTETKEVVDEPKQEKTANIQKAKKRSKSVIMRNVHNNIAPEIPELKEFAIHSDSYEDFASAIAKWLEINKKHDLFVNILIAATQVKKIAWKDIRQCLTSKGINFTDTHRQHFSNVIANKFMDSQDMITILVFIRAVAKFKTFDFRKENIEGENTDKAENFELENTVLSEGFDGKTGIEAETEKTFKTMQCMPKIPEFEEALNSIDKTKPIEERIKHVLLAMGWEDDEKNDDQYTIFNIANSAIRLKEMSVPVICSKIDIPSELFFEARMIFTKFINDFVGKYYSDTKVKFSTFLKELQSFVMLEDEIT